MSNPTAVGDAAQPAEAGPATPEVTTPDTASSPAVPAKVYARRRRAVATLVLAALLIPGWHVASNLVKDLTAPATLSAQGHPAPKPAAKDVAAHKAASTDPAQSARTSLLKTLEQAAHYHAQEHTYRGYRAGADTLSATGTNTLVIATKIDDTCWYAGLLPGQEPKILNDPSACNRDLFTQAQDALDLQDAITTPPVAPSDAPETDPGAAYWDAQLGD